MNLEKITLIKVKELNNYEFNSKNHPPEQIGKIADSINKYGFNVPVVVDSKNVIVAGHGRVEAAMTLGMDIIPCIVKKDLTDKEVREYRILDNRISEYSSTNMANILREIQELPDLQAEFPEIDIPKFKANSKYAEDPNSAFDDNLTAIGCQDICEK